MRFLIVDDELISRLLLKRALQAFGRVEVVATGTEALDAVREALDAGQPYTLVALDYHLPDQDGVEVLKAIRALETERGLHPGEAGLVMMATATRTPKVVMGAFKHHLDAFLVKPISRARLAATLAGFGLVSGEALEAIFPIL
jgi:two-component system chemotaxis response regulator CheY